MFMQSFKYSMMLWFVLWCSVSKGQNLKQYGASTMDSIYKYYASAQLPLFREHYPQDENYRADYLGTDAKRTNKYSYLWPFSGVISAQVALYELDRTQQKRQHIDQYVLQGLKHYYDKRTPPAYASYINTAEQSDRFYDDNIWIGIDFVDLYLLTNEEGYLDNAKEIWTFIESGTDDKLGGGIYWCEQRKESKNTCSNAPGSVFALKLYQATQDLRFLKHGKALYHWTKENLQDRVDHLYFDNIHLDGQVDKTKYSYNSGQMIQAAALLYSLTGEDQYLEDAKQVATASHEFFFSQGDGHIPLLRGDNVWFHAVMLRGFIELYHLDGDRSYLDLFKQNMEFAWAHMRDKNGLFGSDWTLKRPSTRKWLLNQFAMVEMFARLSSVYEQGHEGIR